MVATDHDNLNIGRTLTRIVKEAIQVPLRRNRGVDGIKHITGDDERIDLSIYDLIEQPGKKSIMFGFATEPM